MKLKEPDAYLKARTEVRSFPLCGCCWASIARLSLRRRRRLYLACAYVLFVYMPTFAVRQLRLPFSQALIATTLASAVLFVCSPVIAAISDRYGRKPLLVVGASAFAVLTYPAFV